MTIRQEETTPIGDFFHDSGVHQIFNQLETRVDDFEVDTTQLISWIDYLVTNLKNLKTHIGKCEKEYQKHINSEEIRDMINRGAE